MSLWAPTDSIRSPSELFVTQEIPWSAHFDMLSVVTNEAKPVTLFPFSLVRERGMTNVGGPYPAALPRTVLAASYFRFPARFGRGGRQVSRETQRHLPIPKPYPNRRAEGQRLAPGAQPQRPGPYRCIRRRGRLTRRGGRFFADSCRVATMPSDSSHRARMIGAFVALRQHATRAGLQDDKLAVLCAGLELRPFRDAYCSEPGTLSAIVSSEVLELPRLLGSSGLQNDPRGLVVDVESDVADAGRVSLGQRFAFANSRDELSRVIAWSSQPRIRRVRASDYTHEHGEWPDELFVDKR